MLNIFLVIIAIVVFYLIPLKISLLLIGLLVIASLIVFGCAKFLLSDVTLFDSSKAVIYSIILGILAFFLLMEIINLFPALVSYATVLMALLYMISQIMAYSFALELNLLGATAVSFAVPVVYWLLSLTFQIPLQLMIQRFASQQ